MTRGTIPFIKAHGAGNDFIVLDEQQSPIPEDLCQLAPGLCCRRTGVGADGILVIRRANPIPAMECWNSDGSRAEACGNGLRVISLILSDGQEGDSTIDTDAGRVRVQQQSIDGQFAAEADLGLAQVDSPRSFSVADTTLEAIPVNIGNPHLVVLIDPDATTDPVRRFGPTLEYSVATRANVGFVRIEARDRLVLRVWERGCGETLACGTGAAAAFAALQQRGVIAETVLVQMPGGFLRVRAGEQGDLHVQGPARISFAGQLKLPEENSTLNSSS
ncbi:MAG: diaminopimelate epimerase [Planctomycetota bacterium]|nr:diaminopimelate epimerase [Planctomycetota bacterium]